MARGRRVPVSKEKCHRPNSMQFRLVSLPFPLTRPPGQGKSLEIAICLGGTPGFSGGSMPSRRSKSAMARKIRQARKGKARKRAEQNKGTTPKFPIHQDK